MRDIIEILEEAKKLLGKRRQIIVMFGDWLEPDACYEGTMVDEMMGCEEGEVGVLMSSSLKEDIKKLDMGFVTILDKPRPNYAPFGSIPVEIK